MTREAPHRDVPGQVASGLEIAGIAVVIALDISDHTT
jgi:hypothetical protein